MKIVFLTLFTFSLMTSLHAQDRAKLIDRELFFGNPEISGSQLSPDGKHVTFLKEYDGIMNIWIKKTEEPFEKAIPLTNQKRPMYGYFWTDDSKYVLFVKDNDGDENINIFAIDPYKGKLPEARNLTPMKDVAAQIVMVSRLNPDKLMVGLNNRDKKWHDLYELHINDGKLTMIYENKDRITDFNFDWDEKLRLLSKTDEKGNTKTYRINNDKSLSEIYDINVNEGASFVAWNKDNSKVYLETNKGNLDKSELYLMDPNTKELTLVEKDPKDMVDFGSLFIDDNTREVINTSYTYDKRVRYWKNKTWEAQHKFLESKFPGREIEYNSFTHDYSKMLISTYSDKYVPEVYFYDATSKDLKFQYCPRPKLKAIESELVEMKPIEYKSSDGLTIHGYLSIPKGMDNKTVPLIALIHGGPKGPRDGWGYRSDVQFLCNRGFAVFQPNFRASGGFGKKFLNAGDKQWGKLMQDDITWGVNSLVNQGIADKNKLVIMGGSYGGYATLAGLAYTPELYTCGVDIVGPSNLFTLMESIPPYWEAGRAMLYEMVGNPNTEEGKKLMTEASPIFHVDKMNRPLMVIQGANDPRVKQAEADQIVVALRNKGKKVDYLLAKDEGHGFRKPLNNKAMYAAIEKFLSEVIGTPYQKDMPEDVAKTLKELTVDVSKVVYEPKKEVATTNAAALPKLMADLKEETHNYNATIEVQGQTIPLKTTRTIKKDGNNFRIKDVTMIMGQDASDENTIASDFSLIKRAMSQGGNEMEINCQNGNCKMSAMGNEMDIKLEGETLLDGPGMDMQVARLSLKQGNTIQAKSLDMMSGKLKTVSITHKGLENGLQVVEVVNVDNAAEVVTMWIDSANKQASKIISVIPAMGNAKFTLELAK